MTSSVPTLESVIDSCRHLVESGAALHWLVPGKKMPVDKNWSSAPVADVRGLIGSYRNGANIGIRLGEPSKTELGYLYLIDLDIRDPSQAADAWAALIKMWPDCKSFPTVISGSGGESRHIYFICDQLLRKTKLAKSATFQMVHDQSLDREVRKNDWEIDLLGTGAQAVLPPSIHPDTGLPYRWQMALHTDGFCFGIGPLVSAELVASWGAARVEDQSDDDEDYLFAELAKAPLGIVPEEIDRTLADLPETWFEDRDQWVTVGAALHHEYEGSQIGFDKWCEWSRQSSKFDMKTQKSVWKSFRGTKNPIRMATLISAAGQNRVDFALPAVIEQPIDMELEALLGGPLTGENGPAITESSKIDANWRSYLQITEEGGVKPVLHNIELIVTNDSRTRGVIALNEFTQTIVRVNQPGIMRLKKESPKPVVQLDSPIWAVKDPVNGDLWIDSHDHSVRATFEAPIRQGGYEFKITDRDLTAAVNNVAGRQRYHPVRNYLNAVEWDRVRRAEMLFINYLGCEDTPYHREAARLTLLGAVARVMEPGHKFDFVPILEGLQGKRKSTFIRILAREWFSELSGDFHNNQAMVEQIQGSWIIEIPELQGFSRADTNVLKAWVSRGFDKVRLAYARRADMYPRQCIFIGSTNDDEYLRDATGGRRFWPIKCGLDDREIDTEGLDQEMDLIWAEAVAMYHQLRKTCKLKELPLYLHSDEAKAEAKALQDSRRVETAEDVMMGDIEAWLDEPIGSAEGYDDLDPNAPPLLRNFTCTSQIWREMMNKDIGTLGVADATRIGKALGRLSGWSKFSVNQLRTKAYGKQRVFRRKGTQESFDHGL